MKIYNKHVIYFHDSRTMPLHYNQNIQTDIGSLLLSIAQQRNFSRANFQLKSNYQVQKNEVELVVSN